MVLWKLLMILADGFNMPWFPVKTQLLWRLVRDGVAIIFNDMTGLIPRCLASTRTHANLPSDLLILVTAIFGWLVGSLVKWLVWSIRHLFMSSVTVLVKCLFQVNYNCVSPSCSTLRTYAPQISDAVSNFRTAACLKFQMMTSLQHWEKVSGNCYITYISRVAIRHNKPLFHWFTHCPLRRLQSWTPWCWLRIRSSRSCRMNVPWPWLHCSWQDVD